MKFGGPLSEEAHCIKVGTAVIEHWRRQVLPVRSDGSGILRYAPEMPFCVLPCLFPETGQGLQRELPCVADVRHECLQDTQRHLPVVFAFVIYPASDCGNVREILFLREKPPNFQVRILSFFAPSEKLQDYAIAVDDRTVALFRLYWLRL